MGAEKDRSLGGEATYAGKSAGQPHRADVSLGDERTVGAGDATGFDTVIDDFEVVDLEARYKIEGTLGQGGMGAVLLATDTRLGRKVAIKRILGEAARSKTATMRFLTEAKAIAALNHPNIVQIHDYGRAKDGPFLIMEYVDGGSLLDKCRESALPLDEAISLACQLCDGLAKAHGLGIIHRDIKPANVLLTRDGTPKLTDFGLAKNEANDHGMTTTGAVMGTPDFMPPEQRRDAAEVDRRSDLWSLAATVYQMVTGRSPKIIRFDLLPSELTKVLGRSLEEEKDARYQTAREFRDALTSIARWGENGPSKAATIVEGDDAIQYGQCKACGTVNPDISRKFCRNPKCGASLREACLKCEAPIPVWEDVCGECGGNQPALLEVRRAALATQRAEAQRLAAALQFDAALRCVESIAAESRAEFADIANWATSFVATTTEAAACRRMAATKSLQDAHKHAEACDYPAAIHTLESIPEPLRDPQATALLSACRSWQHEADRLIVEISYRIKRRELAGLLPLVERAVELRRDRKDLAKIRGQLSERRNEALARAEAAIEGGDISQAAAALGGFTAQDFGKHDAGVIAKVGRLLAFESELAKAFSEAHSDGFITPDKARSLLKLCEEYLQLNPQGAKVRDLAKRCREIVTPLRFMNSVGIELLLLAAGTFRMGEGPGNDTPHQVTLTSPFYIGVYEVTNAQWKRVMGNPPSRWKDDDHPVERVSWDQAVEFCWKLSAHPDEQKAGRVYRLPTEAEWEYACRAGSNTRYSFGDRMSELSEYAWYDANAGKQTHPVGQRKPNAWGLHDMHGNVSEWCSDWYDYGAGGYGAVTDPQGPPSATHRPSGGIAEKVVRGGSWFDSAWWCRSACRRGITPLGPMGNVGFRLALSVAADKPSEAGR